MAAQKIYSERSRRKFLPGSMSKKSKGENDETHKNFCDGRHVYFGDGKRRLDFNYIIRQRGLRTSAEMNIRGALNDECDKIFRGTLDFERGTKGSVGRELEEVIILSDTVRNRSVPLMLSNEDDVDGHHAVSVGRLDDEKIFYLMSRGLDKVEAEKLIVEAAFNPVLEKISDESLRAEILDELQRRLSNE